jgi:NIMA (never in mitosis gene a)-related kinase 1/4/5
MEFAENGDLADKLKCYKKRGMFFEEKKIWKYAAEIVSGLKCLHDLKIFHRDLKCANIFLGANN